MTEQTPPRKDESPENTATSLRERLVSGLEEWNSELRGLRQELTSKNLGSFYSGRPGSDETQATILLGIYYTAASPFIATSFAGEKLTGLAKDHLGGVKQEKSGNG